MKDLEIFEPESKPFKKYANRGHPGDLKLTNDVFDVDIIEEAKLRKVIKESGWIDDKKQVLITDFISDKEQALVKAYQIYSKPANRDVLQLKYGSGVKGINALASKILERMNESYDQRLIDHVIEDKDPDITGTGTGSFKKRLFQFNNTT